MDKIYKSVLVDWCDRMCELQITECKEPYFWGGILCPSCGRIHGRIADAVYPLLTAAKLTGDKKYIVTAENAFTWAEQNVLRKNGAFFNDKCSMWTGVTVFLCISMAEALIHCKEVLSAEFETRLKLRLREGLDYCHDFIPTSLTVINYKLSIAGALAVGAKALGDESYMEKAKGIVEKASRYLGEKDGLLWGELSDYSKKDGDEAINILSPKGCRAVDIGYNVEETLPSLCLYAELAEDKKLVTFLEKALHDHLFFMLPDGGWDNSFGVRHAKWTYWGSRTSDGCQGAYARFATLSPLFGEVAQRSFMQYVNCTAKGLLHGGPMYYEEQELPCLHHTFCHAKSVADLLNMGFAYGEKATLPFDEGEVYKYFPTVDVHLLRQNKWRATVSGFDIPANADDYSTATLTLLREDYYGTVFAASMPRFGLVEPANMQYSIHTDSECQTPRIEYTEDGEYYTNLYNRRCVVNYLDNEKVFQINGTLNNANFEGDVEYKLAFDFSGENVVITAQTQSDSWLVLPVVAGSKDVVEMQENTLTVWRNECILKLKASEKLESDYDSKVRNFNPCGGFATYPVKIKLFAKTRVRVEISIGKSPS